MAEIILYQLIDIIGSHTVYTILFFAVLDKKIDWKKFWVFMLATTLPSGITFFLTDHIPGLHALLSYALNSMGTLIYITAAACFIWKKDMWHSFSIAGITAILQVSAASVCSSLSLYLTGFFNSYTVFLNRFTVYMAVTFLIYIPLSMLLYCLLRNIHFGSSIRYLLEDRPHIRHTAMFILLLECAAELLFILRTSMTLSSLISYNTAVIILLLFALCIFIYLSFKRESVHKLKLQETMLLQQQVYMKQLEDMQREMRIFRHDYKNTLSGMCLYAAEGEIEKIQHTLKKMEIDFDQKIGEKIQLTTQLGNIRIPEVKSLILSKITKMEKNSIPCRLEVLYPVTDTGIELLDFNRCLGILLDNALEAAAGLPDPYVELVLLCNGGFLTLRVTNPCPADTDISSIWIEGFSSKGKNRGLGLSNYQQILAQYPDTMPMTSCEGQTFIQELTIPLSETVNDRMPRFY